MDKNETAPVVDRAKLEDLRAQLVGARIPKAVEGHPSNTTLDSAGSLFALALVEAELRRGTDDLATVVGRVMVELWRKVGYATAYGHGDTLDGAVARALHRIEGHEVRINELAAALVTWRRWSDEVAPPFGSDRDRSDDGQRAHIKATLAELREKVAAQDKSITRLCENVEANAKLATAAEQRETEARSSRDAVWKELQAFREASMLNPPDDDWAKLTPEHLRSHIQDLADRLDDKTRRLVDVIKALDVLPDIVKPHARFLEGSTMAQRVTMLVDTLATMIEDRDRWMRKESEANAHATESLRKWLDAAGNLEKGSPDGLREYIAAMKAHREQASESIHNLETEAVELRKKCMLLEQQRDGARRERDEALKAAEVADEGLAVRLSNLVEFLDEIHAPAADTWLDRTKLTFRAYADAMGLGMIPSPKQVSAYMSEMGKQRRELEAEATSLRRTRDAYDELAQMIGSSSREPNAVYETMRRKLEQVGDLQLQIDDANKELDLRGVWRVTKSVSGGPDVRMLLHERIRSFAATADLMGPIKEMLDDAGIVDRTDSGKPMTQSRRIEALIDLHAVAQTKLEELTEEMTRNVDPLEVAHSAASVGDDDEDPDDDGDERQRAYDHVIDRAADKLLAFLGIELDE